MIQTENLIPICVDWPWKVFVESYKKLYKDYNINWYQNYISKTTFVSKTFLICDLKAVVLSKPHFGLFIKCLPVHWAT